MKICGWVRQFDGHFAIACFNKTGERANRSWKPDRHIKETRWNFKFCPYCGGEIYIKRYIKKI